MSIIKRQILYPGKQDLGKLEPDTKLLYHFETVVIRKDKEPLVIDDSRRMANGQPVETIYGKQFKLPIWESCLTSMRKGEICKLTVRDDPVTHYICLNYVVTSKCFRKYHGVEPTNNDHGNDHGHDHHSPSTGHNCSMSIRDSPYKDLNELISDQPEIFEFTFELVDAIPPKSYTKDIWQMTDEEKLAILPKFREDGNKYYCECDYEKAVSSYSKGLSAIESLMLKEKPGDVDWKKLAEMKKPFLLNLAQVKLNQGEYYECIKFTDEVLKLDPENVKALFRRAKAHAGVWNINDARDDLRRCVEYDGTMTKTVAKCFQELKQREEIKNKEDRERFAKMFSK
jgi:AH receptor-interacting protein